MPCERHGPRRNQLRWRSTTIRQPHGSSDSDATVVGNEIGGESCATATAGAAIAAAAAAAASQRAAASVAVIAAAVAEMSIALPSAAVVAAAACARTDLRPLPRP